MWYIKINISFVPSPIATPHLPWPSSLLCCVHHVSAATGREGDSCVHAGETIFVYMLVQPMPQEVVHVHPCHYLCLHAEAADAMGGCSCSFSLSSACTGG